MKTASSIVAIALTLVAVGCEKNNAQTQGAQNAPSGAQGQSYAQNCPFSRLSDVHASVADIHDGVAITFTAPESELSYLRDDVQALKQANDTQGDAFAACQCNPNAQGSTNEQGTTNAPPVTRPYSPYGSTENMPQNNGSSSTSGTYGYGPGISTTDQNAMQQSMRVPASARVDEIPTGAVLRLSANDSSQVQALRDEAHSQMHAMKRACMNPHEGNK